MKKIFKIHPKNLPPGFSGIHTVWLAVLTVHIFGLHEGAYWAIGTMAVFMAFGWFKRAANTGLVDLFEPLKGQKDE